MSDYDNVVDDYFEAPARQAALSIDDSPDRAVRARQLSKATGQPQLAVYNDLDRADQEHKADLSRMIVGRNDKLSAYIRGEPLAAVVSNDDYGNLDNISRAAKDVLDYESNSGIKAWIPGPREIFGPAIDTTRNYISKSLLEGTRSAIQTTIEGFGYDFNKGDFNFYLDKALNDYMPGFTENNPIVTEAYRAIELGVRSIVGTTMSPINFGAGFVGGAGSELARNLGYESAANKLQQELPETVLQGVMGGGGPVHATQVAGHIIRAHEAAKAAKFWLDAGVDVPRGVHPLIDEIKAKVNDTWVDKIQKVLDESLNSATKERDLDLFNSYSKIEFEDGQMGISGDRVVALYGDKIPEPGDGLLGWVPGIKEKFEAAKQFGEDVHISKADWLTHMDPALFKELRDDVRAWPGGITKNEAALKDVAAPAIGANKEMAPVKEAVPEIEPRILGERLDAYREEYRNMPEDATFDERGIRQPGLRDALDTVSSPFGVTGDRGREALAGAIKHDRPDIAEALVQRVELEARASGTTPGVPETSPKYNEIKKDLERRKKEAEDYAAELREKLNESKLKNDTLLDGALPQTRAAAGLEPMFAIGDRKLELKREAETNPFQGMDPKELAKSDGLNWEDMSRYEQQRYIDASNGSNQRQHAWQFHDEKGNVVGQLLINPNLEAKQLYVDWIGGLGKFGPSSFGPSLIRDIKRQLKEAYPEFETIAGHRVSGARYSDKIVEDYAKKLAERDGFKWDELIPSEMTGYIEEAHASYKNPTDKVVTKLALSDAFEMSKEYTDLRRILETAPTKFGDVTADLVPKELWTKNEHAINQAMQEEVNRIAGKTVEPILAGDIRYEGIDGIRGVYHKAPGEVAKILVAALDPDKIGILRHELIHHLYREGFFTPEEWNALIEASKAEGWIERYGIADRYGHLNELGMHEEAIAEAFRDWARTREQQPINPVTTVFQKIWDLMQRIKDRVAEILGREPTFNELFEQAYSGELAQRERTKESKVLKDDRFNEQPKFAKGKEPPPVEKGKIRYYHGTAFENAKDFEGKTFLTPQYEYARDYRGGPNNVFYTDFTREEAIQRGLYDEINNFPKIGSIDDGAARLMPHTIKESAETKVEPTAKQKEELQTQLKAEAAGLDAKSFKRIQDLIQKRYQEDIAAAVKRAEQEQRTIQSKEWKEAAREIRKEAEKDVRARPDIQADLLIGSGELGGKKLERNRYELLSDDLSPEQKAVLPRHYYAKDGVPVDTIANLFGYSDGNHLIEALAEVNKGKEGRSAQENLKRLIDEETNRRMEEKYGKLQDNIMLDAMDQALSETNLQILSEEWQGAAMAAGVKVVDKNVAKAEVMRMFDNMKMSDINVERLLGIMGKVGRDTERALIAGKNAEALVLMQRKYQTALLAAEARKIQKEQASAEKTFKTLSKREVSSMEPEYTDYAHQIMMQIGKPVRRSIQDLQEALARHDGQGNLKDFVERKQQDFRAIDAWDQLYDASWRKDYSELTTSEFRAIHDTIKTLVHNGREERKIYKAGEAADWADLKTEFVDSIQTAAHNKLAKVGKGKKSLLPDQYFTGVVQMETFLNRLDGYNPRNNWFQYVFRGLADGTAQFDKWKKDYAKKISALPSPDNLGRTIDNPLFKNQKNDMPLTFTRRDLIGVMLNTGNDTNLVKMSHGYKLKSDDVMAWVKQHATRQDWEFVQGIWDIFKEIKRDTDTMYRSLSGVAPENIPIRPIDTPHGQFAGGYYPLIRHPEFGDVATKRFKDVLAQENWVNTLPAAGHTKLRTGAIYPLATNLDYMVGHMNQMLFDNAMRPAIIQASKVFHDKAISNAVYKYFGQAWEGELHDYIVGVANSQNYMAKNMQGFAWLSETLRQNMIGNVVGLNPSTPMKHGPTALVLSMKEVGPMEFAKAVRMLHTVNETTGAKWMKFVDENSLEIQRRDRNWQETLFGGVASHDPTNAVEYYRQKMIQFASKPVAWSDMASARPTWLAAYLKAMEEGSDHGEAVALGDRAVRRAHGSTASTSRTAVQRNWNPWFVSIYNFWSDILNRQIETVWKAGDIYKLTEGNPVQKGLATAPTILGGAFAYVIWPMIVENIVSPHPHKDDESWASKAGKSLLFTLSGGWPILRDIGSAMAMGRDPQMGFTGTALSTGYNVIRDFMKNEPFNKEHAGRLIQDWASVVGAITGGPGVQLGRVLRFGLDTYTGKENPKNAWQWAVGLRYGTTNKHSQSWDDYWKGKH